MIGLGGGVVLKTPMFLHHSIGDAVPISSGLKLFKGEGAGVRCEMKEVSGQEAWFDEGR